MAELLDPTEAYKAGLQDGKLAQKRAARSMSGPMYFQEDFQRIERDEVDRLYQARIDRGELPLAPHLLEKAS